MEISLKKTMIAASAGVIFATGIFFYRADIGYEVTFNGQDLGCVQERETITTAVEIVNQDLKEKYGENIVLEQDVDFSMKIINRDNILKDVDESIDAVVSTYGVPMVEGAVIVIDGEEVASLYSKEEAQKVIDNVLEPYTKESKKSKIVGEPVIKEKVEIVNKQILYKELTEVEKAIDTINQGTDKLKQYTVKDGDTTWDIAVNRGIDVEKLAEANPDKNIEKLHGGDTINLTVVEPYLTIEVVREESVVDKIPFETEYRDDSSIYQGRQKVIIEGRQGLKETISKVLYVNGKESSREVLNQAVLKEPTTETIAKGTKALPIGAGKGAFTLPTSGRVTALNKAGSHSGDKAVDIANNMGTPIKAAADGIVVTASPDGGTLGKYIKINHGSGYSTLYGHLSGIHVEVGQKVRLGEEIAAMGSTG
ncbi:peptidoglycan DD-metalloendopeptidase family protein, partial [Alkalibaculum bacchi]|uniref:peptidoglycan DD-metalloendopeptidase family protein n=1 Tax=Alkalibaculum bacchi TaxID=645887 RepID=UPI0026F24CB5